MTQEQNIDTGLGKEAAASFFAGEERILSDIAGNSNFRFKRGSQWAIDPETGNATYDPKFFEDRGYSGSQALFGAFHEIKAHMLELEDLLSTSQGRKAYEKLKSKSKKEQRFHLWRNIREDIKGNRAILRFAPALGEEVETLYREKLFPVTDFTHDPRHLQFMDAIIRRAMVPGEEVKISPEVEEAIAKLRNIKGKDVIELVTDPSQDPYLALRLSEKYIEPVIDELYQKDKEDKKKQDQDKDKNKNKNQSNNQQGNGDQSKDKNKQSKSTSSPSEPFADEYKKREENHPEPMKEDDVEKKIKKAKELGDPSLRQDSAYENENGVKKEDVANYYAEYQKIEEYIVPLREIFQRIIQERTIPKRRLGSLKEEGVMIDPGLVAQTYLDVKAGALDPKTMKDFEGFRVPENIPASFSIHLVADQSSSMRNDEKYIAQRRTAILLMESLKEFSDLSRAMGDELIEGLDIQTELRSFGTVDTESKTTIYKELSPELSEKQRIQYFKGLLNTRGGTNDFTALSEIESELKQRIIADPQYGLDLKSGRKREIVIVLSDGESGNREAVSQRLKKLREMGVKVVGVGITESARAILNTYSPEGKVCHQVGDLPKVMGNLLEKYLSDLSVGNLFDILKTKGE